MARRIVGIDNITQLQPVQPQVQSGTINVSPSEQVWDRTAATNQEAYNQKQRGIGALQEEQQANQAKIINRANQASPIAQAIGAASEALKTFAAIKQERQQVVAGQREALQQQNYDQTFNNITQDLLKSQEEIANSADTSGIYTTMTRITDSIDSTDLSAEQRQQLRSFLFTQLDQVQTSRLAETRTATREAQSSAVDARIEAAKTPLLGLSAQLSVSRDPSQSQQLIGQIFSTVQEAVSVMPTNTPQEIADRNRLQTSLLEMANASVGDNAELQAGIAQNRLNQQTWEEGAAVLTARYEAGQMSLQDYNSEMRKLESALSGTNLYDVTTAQDAQQEILDSLQRVNSIENIQRERYTRDNPVGISSNVEVSRIVFESLQPGGRSIEDYNIPGNESAYNQIRNAREIVETSLNSLNTLRGRSQSLQSDGTRVTSQIQTLRALLPPDGNLSNPQWQAQYNRAAANSGGSIPPDPTQLAGRLGELETQAQGIAQEQQLINQQLTETQEKLRPLGFANGLSGWQQWYESPEVQQQVQAAAAAQAQQQSDTGGPTENFTSEVGGSAPQPLARVSRSVASTRFGGSRTEGLPSPFPASVGTERVLVTSEMRSTGSHTRGRSIDYGIEGSPNGIPVAALASGRITRVVTGCAVGDIDCGGRYGNHIYVDPGDGRTLVYAHFDDVENLQVGQTLRQGQILGTMGTTGHSSGNHVHVEIKGGNQSITEYLASITTERTPANFTQGVSGVGLPPRRTPILDDTVFTHEGNELPSNSVTLPNGMQIVNGRVYFQGETPPPADGVGGGGQVPLNTSPNAPVDEVFNTTNPIRGVLASGRAADYDEPNNINHNFGYQTLEDNQSLRVRLNQAATNAGVPTQWLADIVAYATQGQFTPRVFRSGNTQQQGSTSAALPRVTPESISQAAEYIGQTEGFRETAYWDYQQYSIGFGTRANSANERITREEGLRRLGDNVQRFQQEVANSVTVPLTPQQMTALTSFVYNVGEGNFRESTLLRKLNAGDYEGAANEFARWNQAGGRVLEGLVTRRAHEADLFRQSTPRTSSPATVSSSGQLAGIVPINETTARRLGVDPRRLATMAPEESVQLIGRILEPLRGRINTMEQLWGVLFMGEQRGLQPSNTWDARARGAFQRVGQNAGRRYESVESRLGINQPVHTTLQAGCQLCDSLQASNSVNLSDTLPTVPPHLGSIA
jgi:lysozyme